MQVLTGRLTADAKVATLTDDRQVVNFSIALNNSYKTKSGERRTQTTFVECAYWLSTSIAPYLKKGGVVEVNGFISVDAYTNSSGDAKGVLRFHVSRIQLHGNSKPQEDAPQSGKSNKSKKKSKVTTADDVTEPVEDLPF